MDHLVLSLSGAKGSGRVNDPELDDLRAGFEAKFWAQFRSLKIAQPFLAQRTSITFVSAVSARMPPGTVSLAAINGAIEAMIRPLAVELAPVQVNAVSPGVTDTAWWNWLPKEQKQGVFDQYGKTSRVGQTGEVAQVIKMPVGNAFMTGQLITCDGGLSLKAGG